MGAIQEPTPEMGEWTVEVRRESFYLVGSGYTDWKHGEGPEPEHTPRLLGDYKRSTAWCNRTVEVFAAPEYPADVGFAIPAADIDKVLAALQQVHSTRVHAAWMDNSETGPEANSSSYFRAEKVDGWIRLYGPVIVYGEGEPWRLGQSVEIAYRYLPWLFWPLIASRETATATCPGCSSERPCEDCHGSGDRCDSIALRKVAPRCDSCAGTGFGFVCSTEGTPTEYAEARNGS